MDELLGCLEDLGLQRNPHAALALATICHKNAALLLEDPAFAAGKLAARCLAAALASSSEGVSHRRILNRVLGLDATFALQLYYFAYTCTDDDRVWLCGLLMDESDDDEVTRQYHVRLHLRLDTSYETIDLSSTILDALIRPAGGWYWLVFSLSMFLPLGWFLGSRWIVLEPILQAACGPDSGPA
jgi:hypothetical protein